MTCTSSSLAQDEVPYQLVKLVAGASKPSVNTTDRGVAFGPFDTGANGIITEPGSAWLVRAFGAPFRGSTSCEPNGLARVEVLLS